MRKNHFNNFNNVSSKQNNNENEDSLNGNSAQISNIESNKNNKPENNNNNLYENKKTEDNTYNNIILPNNNNYNGTNLSNNNNHISILFGVNDDEISDFGSFNSGGNLSFNSFDPINGEFIDETLLSKEDFFGKDFISPLPLINDIDDHKINDTLPVDSSFYNFDILSFLNDNNYSMPLYSINHDSLKDKKDDYTFSFYKSFKSSEVNPQGNIFLSKKRPRGRPRKDSKEKEDGTKRHTNKEIGNVTRKMLTSLKKKVHKFIKTFTRFKFYELTIKKFITGSHRKIRKFLKLTLFKLYHSHTLPKNFKGVKLLKLKDINNLKKRRKKKIEALKEYKKSIIKIIDDEKAQEIKPVTAILDLTLLNFLKIYLDYGYIDNIKKEIEIDENKYGLKFIYLQGFPTYYETKNEFSSNESEQNYYREHLKRIINRKERFFHKSLRYKPVQKDKKKRR